MITLDNEVIQVQNWLIFRFHTSRNFELGDDIGFCSFFLKFTTKSMKTASLGWKVDLNFEADKI